MNSSTIKINEIIGKKYKITEYIDSGSFSNVCKGINIYTNENVAIKLENKNSKGNLLKHETNILKYLSNKKGFSSLKWFSKYNDYNYLVLDLQGNSLFLSKLL